MRATALLLLVASFAFAKTATPAPTPNYFGCTVDSDCTKVQVKIMDNCCWLGQYVAINTTEVAAWEKAHQCAQTNTSCPLALDSSMVIMHDTRVPLCMGLPGMCEMVQPTNYTCGGFTQNPHACPPGYVCILGPIADAGGRCVQTKGKCGGKKHKKCTNPAFPHCQNGECVAECVQNLMCIAGDVWSPTKCECVPGGTSSPTFRPIKPICDPIVCKQGKVWNEALCKCVVGTWSPTSSPIKPICDPIVCKAKHHWDEARCKCVHNSG